MPNIISKRRQNNRLIALISIIMQGKPLKVHYFSLYSKDLLSPPSLGQLRIYTVKPAHVVTSIKQSPVL